LLDNAENNGINTPVVESPERIEKSADANLRAPGPNTLPQLQI